MKRISGFTVLWVIVIAFKKIMRYCVQMHFKISEQILRKWAVLLFGFGYLLIFRSLLQIAGENKTLDANFHGMSMTHISHQTSL